MDWLICIDLSEVTQVLDDQSTPPTLWVMTILCNFAVGFVLLVW